MRFLQYLVVAPVAAVILIFAFANREVVTVYFDPVGGHGLNPVQAPQYVVMLVAVGVGVVAGSVTTWLGQSGRRRAAREAEAEADRLRLELQSARTSPALARRA